MDWDGTNYHLSPFSRHLTLTWCLLVITLSITGNTLVLIASLKYHAIRLDKISVVLIRNIAWADLGTAVFVMVPTVGSLAADWWIWGDVMCVVVSHAIWVFSIVNNLLIAALCCNKLFGLMFPLRARLRRQNSGRKIAGTLWVITTTNAVFYLAAQRPCAFETFLDRCNIQSTTIFWARVDFASSILFAFIPLSIILLSTLRLLFFIRSQGLLQRKNLLLILSVSVVYLVSLGPFIAYYTQRSLSPGLYACAVYTYYISTVSNPFLYYWSSSSFKEFVRRSARAVSIRVQGRNQNVNTCRDPEIITMTDNWLILVLREGIGPTMWKSSVAILWSFFVIFVESFITINITIYQPRRGIYNI